jgi:type IV pilus assembly protein PilN
VAIRINLLGEPEEGPRQGMYWFAGYVSSFLLVLSLMIFWTVHVSSKKEELEGLVTQREAQLAQIKVQTKEVDELEAMQQDLNSKIALIATLKKSKQGPVRVLDDLNTALPELAWLTSIEERSQKMKLTGFALDNQTLAGFMTRLEDSNYFQGVDLIQTNISQRAGVNISQFTVETKVHYAGQMIEDSTGDTDK